MTRFELKKVFSRRINQIVLLVMAVMLAVCINLGLDGAIYSVYDPNAEDGTRTISGHAAAVRLREDAAQYEGELTVDVLRRVIVDNARINAMPEAQSDSVPERNYAYTLTQGYRDIMNLFGMAYAPFNKYDYLAIDRLTPEDADRFYSLRTQGLIDWLDEPEHVNWFTGTEREFLIDRYEALETPMLYRTHRGWVSIFNHAPSLLLLMSFILAFLLSGIFAEEAHLRTDSILFSTFHGRKKAVWAKVKAGLAITNGVYWGCMLLFSAVLLLLLGAEGWDCPVQISGSGWTSMYNISIWQKYLLTLVCGWVGMSVISMTSMLISAKTNSATLSVAVPVIFISIPQLLANFTSMKYAEDLISLMPADMFQINSVVASFNLYLIGGRIFTQLQVAPLLHLSISVLLVPLVYRIYRKKIPA